MSAPKTIRRLVVGGGLLLVLNLLLLVLVVRQTSQAQTYSARAKFMYKVVKTNGEEQSLQTVVDLFSRDGWELVTQDSGILIFKK